MCIPMYMYMGCLVVCGCNVNQLAADFMPHARPAHSSSKSCGRHDCCGCGIVSEVGNAKSTSGALLCRRIWLHRLMSLRTYESLTS